MQRHRNSPPLTCPLCKDHLSGTITRCDDCGTEFHAACDVEMGGCPTLGCAGRQPTPQNTYTEQAQDQGEHQSEPRSLSDLLGTRGGLTSRMLSSLLVMSVVSIFVLWLVGWLLYG